MDEDQLLYACESLDENLIIEVLLRGDNFLLEQGRYLIQKDSMVREQVQTVAEKGNKLLIWTVCPGFKHDNDVQHFNFRLGIYGHYSNEKPIYSERKIIVSIHLISS